MPHFTTSDGTTLHYEDHGAGPAVLCLAGLTRNSADFTYLLPHLPDHRVIRLDYRGRGLSEYPEDFMSYNILREGQDAIELLDHLGLERVTLVGTSRGGLIAIALSVTAPARLNGVVLNDIGPEVAPIGLEQIMDYVGWAAGRANRIFRAPRPKVRLRPLSWVLPGCSTSLGALGSAPGPRPFAQTGATWKHWGHLVLQVGASLPARLAVHPKDGAATSLLSSARCSAFSGGIKLAF